MTSRDLLLVVLRRWYLMLLGALLTVAALYVATHQSGVYFIRYTFTLLAPRNEFYQNQIQDPHVGMGAMAGLIVTEYNAGRREPLLASADTTLYGEGLRRGSRVRVPNYGSQWQPLLTTPDIDVQVVGPTQDEVRSEAQRIKARLAGILEQRQDDLGIAQTMQMTSLASPASPVVAYVGGSRGRVAVGVGAVGATLTTILVVQFDRWRERRWEGRPRRRRRRRRRKATDVAAGQDRVPVLADRTG
ncbi:MAG: hypothetical protein L0H79_07035 [Intrasporangium sp.]|uniref:hypothetical protein n=1 Tax=Intrasporangium sp. TaxID=1925024 RepID=UPI002649CB21|nr:hypothetical protein [Intrasporangium sp.]MDN5795492.1 hypothetical protein [Intrasporangium sp.]